jgi:histone H3/H4
MEPEVMNDTTAVPVDEVAPATKSEPKIRRRRRRHAKLVLGPRLYQLVTADNVHALIPASRYCRISFLTVQWLNDVVRAIFLELLATATSMARSAGRSTIAPVHIAAAIETWMHRQLEDMDGDGLAAELLSGGTDAVQQYKLATDVLNANKAPEAKTKSSVGMRVLAKSINSSATALKIALPLSRLYALARTSVPRSMRFSRRASLYLVGAVNALCRTTLVGATACMDRAVKRRPERAGGPALADHASVRCHLFFFRGGGA